VASREEEQLLMGSQDEAALVVLLVPTEALPLALASWASMPRKVPPVTSSRTLKALD